MKHRFLTILTLTLVTGLALAPAALRAQSEKLMDMMGLWMYTGSIKGHKAVFQLTASTPGSIKLGFIRTESGSPGGTWVVYDKEYRVTVNGRNLTGTVAMELRDSNCNAPRRTFPVKGRILPDWSTIVLISNDYLDGYRCRWVKGEITKTFVRYR